MVSDHHPRGRYILAGVVIGFGAGINSDRWIVGGLILLLAFSWLEAFWVAVDLRKLLNRKRG